MSEDKADKFLAIRVFNSTKSCILVKQFKNGVWTLPLVTIPYKSDPFYHINSVLKQIDGKFELASAINMIEYEEKAKSVVTGEEEIYTSVIYDIRYTGKVESGLVKGQSEYINSKWYPIDAIKNLGSINYTTKILADAVKENPSLR